MGAIPIYSTWEPTGAARMRRAWFGRYYVQVQYCRRRGMIPAMGGPAPIWYADVEYRWRNPRYDHEIDIRVILVT